MPLPSRLLSMAPLIVAWTYSLSFVAALGFLVQMLVVC